MKVYCKRCGFYLGEILTGSKLHKGIVYLCSCCHDLFKTYEDLKNYEKGVGSNSMPPGFEEIFKGFKK